MLLCRLVHVVEDALQVALDDVQRGAQLVGYVGGQVAAALVGAFQLLDHVVERGRQPPKLPGVMLGHTGAQIALGHGVGGGHDVGQRRGDAAKGA